MLRIKKRPRAVLVAAVVCLTIVAGSGLGQKGSANAAGSDPEALNTVRLKEPQALQSLNSLRRQIAVKALERRPLSFEPNQGQASTGVSFVGRGIGFALLLGEPGALLTLRANGVGGKSDPKSDVRVRVLGASAGAVAEGINPLPGKTNYILGNNPAEWRTGIISFSRVVYRSIYPGIDMVIYGRDGSFEYDFVVAPKADARAIRFRLDGPQRTRIAGTGDLVMTAESGEIRIHKPIVYQQVAGIRREIPARYSRRGQDMEFEIGNYDRTEPLVIDPVLSYSGYLGGAGNDSGRGIAVDTHGNVYIAGSTTSSSFPGSAPAERSSGDAFVTKLDPSGALLFSTILGGRDSDTGAAVAVDAVGSIYITGVTLSNDFPTVGGIQSQCPPNLNGVCNGAFVTKLNASGSGIIYSTFLPGSGTTFCLGIAADAAGNAYVAGSTTATGFPIVNAAQPAYGGGPQDADGDAFVLKLNSAGTAFLYSTYLGGFGPERASAIAVNGNGDAYVTGFTRSANFPTAGTFQPISHRASAYKTNDGGAEWAPRDTLPSADVTALAVDPESPSTVYAGTDLSGLFKSTDGGTTWRQTFNADQSGSLVSAIVIDPSNKLTVYAARRSGVLKSTDGGQSWVPGGRVIDGFDIRFLLNVTGFAIHPRRPETLFANTGSASFQGPVKSTNGGLSWTPLATAGIGSHGPLAIHPQNAAIIFAGDSKSTDGGDTWSRRFNFGEVLSLAINPANPSTMYLGASGGVYKSTDEGNSWALASTAGSLHLVHALAIDPSNPATVYAGGQFSEGVFKTTDAGATWTVLNSGLTTDRINALAIDPQTPAAVYLGASIPQDAFVARLSAAGSAFTYSTLLGGTQDDLGFGVGVDLLGNAVITGFTSSSDFPLVNPIQPAFAGGFDVFVARVNSTGSLIYSTYLGGSGIDEGLAVAADRSGNAYVVGETQSPNFPLMNPIQTGIGGGDLQHSDGFALKLNAAGALSYSTYLGGSGSDVASAVAVDSNGSAFITGETASTSFPVIGSSQSSGLRDVFALKLMNTDVASPALTIRLNASTASVLTGSSIVYTVSIVNTSGSSIASVSVADNLPSSLSFISCGASPGGVCGGTGNARTVTFPTLAPGEAASVIITAKVQCSTPGGSGILNSVAVGAASVSSISAQSSVTATNPPPRLTCPPGVVIQTTSANGAAVNYGLPTADDNCPGVTAACSPPSGANFPLGTTTVACGALDSGGAPVSCTFTVTVTNSNVPQIDSAAVVGKNLVVVGRGFDQGARILMDGAVQKSSNDDGSPSTTLIGKKVGKSIARGQTVMVQVRNPSGVTSGVFVFRRPD